MVYVILVIGMAFSQSCSSDAVQTFEPAQLSDSEAEDLLFLYEEEKMARDLYDNAYELYDIMQFSKISASEVQHMSYVSSLLEKYNIEYPSELPRGTFENEEVQTLYDSLNARIHESSLEALLAAAFVEETDITDLRILQGRTDKEDILSKLESLECASGNHIRAYVSKLETLDVDYEPVILSDEDLEFILAQQNGHCG